MLPQKIISERQSLGQLYSDTYISLIFIETVQTHKHLQQTLQAFIVIVLHGYYHFYWVYSHLYVTSKILKSVLNNMKFILVNYKTTKYLHMKGVLDSIELRMLRRADYMRECNILGESHIYSYRTLSVFHFGWTDSLLSLAFTTWWNPKHPSNTTMEIRKKMWRRFYFNSCRHKGQIQQHYDGKNFHQKFGIFGSVSMMQRCIINNISKNKH